MPATEYRIAAETPNGGFCFEIRFQNGPIAEAGVNGLTHEALLAVLEDRLVGFQSGPYHHGRQRRSSVSHSRCHGMPAPPQPRNALLVASKVRTQSRQAFLVLFVLVLINLGFNKEIVRCSTHRNATDCTRRYSTAPRTPTPNAEARILKRRKRSAYLRSAPRQERGAPQRRTRRQPTARS